MTLDPHALPTNLILTADDCGLSPGINRDAARLHEAGLITAASIMTNMPAAADAFATFAPCDTLELGVHLNLSDGTPLSALPLSSDLLTGDGSFRNQFLLYAQAVFAGETYLSHIENELRTQIEYFIRLGGRRPQHLTTHCHFHVIASLRHIVYRLAEDYDVVWVRPSDYRFTAVPFNPMLTGNSLPDQPPHLIVPDYLVSLKNWLGHSPEAMIQQLQTIGGLVEMVVHPGDVDDPAYPDAVRYGPAERAL